MTPGVAFAFVLASTNVPGYPETVDYYLIHVRGLGNQLTTLLPKRQCCLEYCNEISQAAAISVLKVHLEENHVLCPKPPEGKWVKIV